MAAPTALVSTSVQLLTVALFILRINYIHESIETDKSQILSAYDFIVVGSGSAGAVVASRLAENPHVTVLLLEAGGPTSVVNDIPAQAFTSRLFSSEYDWNYTNVPDRVGRAWVNGVIPETRGHVIGGTSSFNTMIFNRGNRKTFDNWANKFGAIGWSYEEVLPFFNRYENNTDPVVLSQNYGFHGTSGPIQITSWAYPPPIMQIHQQAVNGLGIPNTDINGPRQLGTTFAQAFIDPRGVRSSTSNGFLDPNPYPKNLHILPRSLVTRVLFKDRTAVGVEFVRAGHSFTVQARREVIVSAGVINSPQLLLLSGVGPKQQLQQLNIPVVADLPVGENLQNHPGIYLTLLIKEKYYNLLTVAGQLLINQFYQYFTTNSGPLASHYRAVTYFNTKNNPEPDYPNAAWETGLYLYATNLSDITQLRYGERRLEWEAYNTRNLGRYYFLVHPILQRVRSRGSVRLASNNPFYYPLIDSAFLRDPKDFEEFVEIMSAVYSFFETSPVAELLEPGLPIPGCSFCPGKMIYQCESYIRCQIEQIASSCYHPAGSCRMGSVDRPDVVVDPRLRVKGLYGVRVCDASIMPEIVNSNTNAASIMIGEKCADLVRQDNNLL